MSATGRAARRGDGDEGAGTVLVLGLVSVLCALVIAASGLGAAVVARHRAASSADLAALAAADRTLGRAPGGPCDAAGRVARANGGLLVGCRVDPDASVTVRVQVGLPGPWRRLGVAQAQSRAGRAGRAGPTSEATGHPVKAAAG